MKYFLKGEESCILLKVSYDEYYIAVLTYGIWYYDEFHKGYVAEVPCKYICKKYIMVVV